MDQREFILSICERREKSIYEGRFAWLENFHEFLNDPATERFVKACAVMCWLGRWSFFEFPRTLQAIHDLVGEEYWAREISFFSPACFTTGPPRPIFLEKGEHCYLMSVGPSDDRFSGCFVYLVTNVHVTAEDQYRGGTVQLPLETPIHRFTLSHPMLKSKTHTPDGIYLFTK